MRVHHIGYLTRHMERTVRRFLELGYVVEQETVYDEDRGVRIMFLVNGAYRVELIEPADERSPFYPLLRRFRNTPYHLCYETAQLEDRIRRLAQSGYTLMQEAEAAPAIGGRRVAFMMNADLGILELVEKEA